jgi:DNA-binding MarR family transcriptional regulator
MNKDTTSVFKAAKQQTNHDITTKLLTKLSDNPETTQRDLATEMGISLGMVVSYLKNCVHKGYIRSKQVAPQRWVYFVTPKGFAEKSKMVAEYLQRSMSFYRDSRMQLDNLFLNCQNKGMKDIAMIGEGEMTEIALLVAKNYNLTLHPTLPKEESLTSFDAVLITDIKNPQGVFDNLTSSIAEHKILSIKALCITRRRIENVEALNEQHET